MESPHPLSPYVARARESVADGLSGLGGFVESGVSRWITFERRVERESSCRFWLRVYPLQVP